MALLAKSGLRDRMETLLVGFAFDGRFGKQVGASAVCRDLSSLFQYLYQRAGKKRRK